METMFFIMYKNYYLIRKQIKIYKVQSKVRLKCWFISRISLIGKGRICKTKLIYEKILSQKKEKIINNAVKFHKCEILQFEQSLTALSS